MTVLKWKIMGKPMMIDLVGNIEVIIKQYQSIPNYEEIAKLKQETKEWKMRIFQDLYNKGEFN